jgi:hypothetical protein
MESQASAKSLLSLFSNSNLNTFTPITARDFYKTSPPPNASTRTALDDVSPERHDRPRKKRRRSTNPAEWTCAEIRALETYRNLSKGDEIDDGLRDVLLPSRTNEEVKAQLARIEVTIRERRGSKLEELEKEENELFVEEERVRIGEMEEDVKRRRMGMDDILGLDKRAADHGTGNQRHVSARLETRKGDDVKNSLDKALGLFEESAEQRRKRELDEALGLC